MFEICFISSFIYSLPHLTHACTLSNTSLSHSVFPFSSFIRMHSLSRLCHIHSLYPLSSLSQACSLSLSRLCHIQSLSLLFFHTPALSLTRLCHIQILSPLFHRLSLCLSLMFLSHSEPSLSSLFHTLALALSHIQAVFLKMQYIFYTKDLNVFRHRITWSHS